MKIRGLTLWRPWPSAFTEGPLELRKRIENRPWSPPAGMMGHFIALHAGSKYHSFDREFIESILGVEIPSEQDSEKGVIFAVGVLAGVVTSEHDARLDDVQRQWFSGPFAWLLADIVPLITPVHCSGEQGLWSLSDEMLEKVRRAYIASSVGAPVPPLDRGFITSQPRLISAERLGARPMTIDEDGVPIGWELVTLDDEVDAFVNAMEERDFETAEGIVERAYARVFGDQVN